MEPQNQQPNTPLQQPVEEDKSAVGPTIALVVIILILLIGGLYFWSQNQDDGYTTPTEYEDPDVTSLEAELQSNSLNETDGDLSDIDAEFESQA